MLCHIIFMVFIRCASYCLFTPRDMAEVLRETCSYLTNCRATNTKLSKNYIKNRNIKDLINFYGYLRVSLKGGLGPVDLPIEVH